MTKFSHQLTWLDLTNAIECGLLALILDVDATTIMTKKEHPISNHIYYINIRPMVKTKAVEISIAKCNGCGGFH